MNWYTLSKVARYGSDRPFDKPFEQGLPWYDPYAKRQKNPNDLAPNPGILGDDGFGMGDTRDFIQQYDAMVHDTQLDEALDGQTTGDPANREPPLDTVTDDTFDKASGLGPSSGNVSPPLGEGAQTLRRANEFFKDNKDGRLPNGTTTSPPRERRRVAGRWASVGGPVESAVRRLTYGLTKGG